MIGTVNPQCTYKHVILGAWVALARTKHLFRGGVVVSNILESTEIDNIRSAGYCGQALKTSG